MPPKSPKTLIEMAQKYAAQIDAFMEKVRAKNPNEPEFLQAVHEVAESVIHWLKKHRSIRMPIF